MVREVGWEIRPVSLGGVVSPGSALLPLAGRANGRDSDGGGVPGRAPGGSPSLAKGHDSDGVTARRADMRAVAASGGGTR